MNLVCKQTFLAVILTLSLLLPATAGPYEEAEAAYARGDYVTALGLFRPLADQGQAQAQVSMGLMYGSGHGVAQDDTEAAKWYRLAADQGHSYAQFMLGLLYASGHGVPQNYVLAYMWLELAAAHIHGPPGDVRDACARLMTKSQIRAAQKLARMWRPVSQPRR